MKLSLVVAGADPAAIRWSYSGAKSVSLDAQGNLAIALPRPRGAATAATLREQAPIAWQERDGLRQEVAVRYALASDGSVSFALPDGYDPSLPLVIDPVLSYSTLLGRSETETGMGIVIAPDGSALRYSTYLGSVWDEEGEEIAVDGDGVLHLAGWTTSSGFPILNGFDATHGGGTCGGGPCPDGFLVSIDPSLSGASSLRYGTAMRAWTGRQQRRQSPRPGAGRGRQCLLDRLRPLE